MAGRGQILVRSALAALALLWVVALLSPLLIGFWLEHRYARLVEEASGGGWLQIESARFERGWFGSRTSLIVRLAGLQPRYVVEQWISHGPLFLGALGSENPLTGLVSAQGRVAHGESSRRFERPIVLGRTWIGLEGDLRSQWREPLRSASSNGRQMDLEIDSQTRRLDLRLVHPGLALHFGEDSVALDGISLEMRMRLLAGGSFPEEVAFRADRIGLEVLDADIALVDSRVVAVFDAPEGRFNAELAASAGRIGEARHGAGPASVKAWLVDLEQLGLTWPLAFPPNRGQRLDRRRPHIEVADLTVLTREGRFLGNATIKLDAQNADWRAIELDADIRMSRALARHQLEQLFRHRLSQSLSTGARGRAEASLLTEEIDERAAIRADKQLAILTTQGYLRRQGEDMRTLLRWRSGQMSLNGKPVELAKIIRE